MNALRTPAISFLTLLVVVVLSRGTRAAEYGANEAVPVLVNTVGPFHNPAETYHYYTLPYCHPGTSLPHIHDGSIADSLIGDRREPSLYDIKFRNDVSYAPLACDQRSLSASEVGRFIDAIANHYVFELFVDDLSVKGFVGEMETNQRTFTDAHIHNDTHMFLFTHLDFSIAYNMHNIISVNLTTDPNKRIELTVGAKPITVEFSYSVRWLSVDTPYSERASYHLSALINEQSTEIHWLSIINSFVLVILLIAFLAVILMRVLHKDFARYMEVDDGDEAAEEGEAEDEVGWKLVHGDVFRAPNQLILLSAAIGNGTQIFVLVVSLLLLLLAGTFYPGTRGSLYLSAVILYALTSIIAGYTSTYFYLQLNGTKWAIQSVVTACLFAIPFFMTFCIINTVAWSYGSSSALPAQTIATVIAIWALISFPLTIFGSMRARHSHPTFDAPCKTNRVEREIPPAPWYRSALLHYAIAGFLPFSAIYIELHYIFVAIYGPRVYTLYGILCIAFLLLLLVTAFITVALTYFQLASEDYHWWWRSFFTGASCGLFMYAYAYFYYMYRSEMDGNLQFAFFFGYMLMVSYAFALMLGTISFFTAMTFVKHIYRSIKID